MKNGLRFTMRVTPERIGERIAYARNLLGARERQTVTQTGLARRVGALLPDGLAENAIWRYETGERTPNPEVIEAIAQVVGCDPGWLSHGAASGAPAPAGWEPPNPGGGESDPRRVIEVERTTPVPRPEGRREAAPPAKQKPKAG